jgi:putative NADH-flavin reductase
MQVTVFGASGKIGRLVTQRLLDEGHSVVAFVHRTELPAQPKLRFVKGDIHDAQAIAKALAGSQAVVSALGSWGTKTKDILSSAMRVVVPAMQEAGIQRIVTLTGSGAYAAGDKPKLLDKLGHFSFGLIAHKIIVDSEEHLRILQDSGLDWTVLRSPVMTNGTYTSYKLNSNVPLPWESISRPAVAKAMVEQLSAKNLNKSAPFIHKT